MYSGSLLLDLWVNTQWMGYNLFLAFIPFVLAKRLFNKRKKRSAIWFAGLVLFVLFLPNAPYVLTDLVHLNRAWFEVASRKELVLIVGQFVVFIGIGYWFFCESYRSFEHFIRRTYDWHHYAIRTFSFGIISAGIYLGRFLRLNSWDVFTQPYIVLNSMRVLNDYAAVVFIFVFSMILFGAYGLYEMAVSEKA